MSEQPKFEAALYNAVTTIREIDRLGAERFAANMRLRQERIVEFIVSAHPEMQAYIDEWNKSQDARQ